MEALIVAGALAFLTWRIAKGYVPPWLARFALRIIVAVVCICTAIALVRLAPEEALVVLCTFWILAGAASFAVRRWRAGEKEREARRAALHAARMQVRRRALPPGPGPRVSASAPSQGGAP